MTTNRLQFATKRDVNGNTYSLVVDLTSKEFSRDNHWIDSEFVRITRAEMRRITEQLKQANFKEI